MDKKELTELCEEVFELYVKCSKDTYVFAQVCGVLTATISSGKTEVSIEELLKSSKEFMLEKSKIYGVK